MRNLGSDSEKSRNMKYRLPSLGDENLIRDYLQEYFDHGEKDIILFQDLLLDDYGKWCELIQNNAIAGNEEWGRSEVLLCFDAASRLVGILCVRYGLSKELENRYGNIGYSVRPSDRNKGYATQMLFHALQVWRDKGREKVIVGCHSDNLASSNVIRKCGGILMKELTESENVKDLLFEIVCK